MCMYTWMSRWRDEITGRRVHVWTEGCKEIQMDGGINRRHAWMDRRNPLMEWYLDR